jgi:hypothetical protein
MRRLREGAAIVDRNRAVLSELEFRHLPSRELKSDFHHDHYAKRSSNANNMLITTDNISLALEHRYFRSGCWRVML